MSTPTKAPAKVKAESDVAEDTAENTVEDSNGRAKLPTYEIGEVLESWDELPSSDKVGRGRTSPYVPILTEIRNNMPGKIVQIATFTTRAGATNASRELVKRMQNPNLATEMPAMAEAFGSEGTWEFRTRRVGNKSELWGQYTPNA